MSIQSVELRNGHEALVPLVTSVTVSLRHLFENDTIAFYEFVMLCRDKTHVLWGNSGEKLKDRGLLLGDGQPHGDVRKIVLASTEGEGMDMILVSPTVAT